MQTNILWTGREYYSLENCSVKTTETGSEISAAIVGKYSEELYRVQYQIITNSNWETIYLEIKYWINGQERDIKFESNGNGRWTWNGKEQVQFQDCIDIDIPLTPFTNTLPIKRLDLKIGEQHQIKVLYLDLLEGKFTAVYQKYSRLSDTQYHYENVPNDFEADITIDSQGFVVDYPSLFVRTAAIVTE
ncbi:putative glycolipid-binding domain-containing protein [Dyadobacter arcticus]|uniref:Transcriptional regulator n=1 Tax=Dyadobacter arcticus TaxID=1078754 RepID=A0ABX0UPE9_9BACT|nr:putative glycolipid-binding domain-containing protein [Dyadobacter arcticus]NIJ53844.1 hypothetical protein [Dyadobacter arcticus]